MHNRRARPTLRVLEEDLNSDWTNPAPRRALEDKRFDALHPLSELPHPIVQRAAECFGEDESEDHFVGPIASARQIALFEIKIAQWRGGVWIDPDTQVCWLVAAGLAKGNHEDYEDFYQSVARENASTACKRWLPTDQDSRLLKLETAARLKTEWFLGIQREVLTLLEKIHAGGKGEFEVFLPVAGHKLADVELTVEQHRDEGVDTDDIEVLVNPVPQYAGHDHVWDLIVRVLCSLAPPAQEWDTSGYGFSNIGDPGAWSERVKQLRVLVERELLEYPEPGRESHYAHREHLAFKSMDGKAVRALCGVRFVPSQDHANLPICPECSRVYHSLA